MAKEIRIPELGENVEDAEVLSVLVSEGDTVERDQPVLELETDKASFEMPSPGAGVVKSIRVSKGDTVEVGQVVFELEAEGAEPEEARGREEEDAPEEEEEEKQERDEKAAAGADEAEEAEPRAAAEDRDDEGERETGKKRERRRAERRREPEAPPEPAAEHAAPPPAAPSVRRLARELGIEVDDVKGSGPDGRISSEDVTGHARALIRRAGTARRRSTAAPALPDFEEFGEVERQPLSGIRRRTAENMTRSWLTIPHVAQHDRADATELERARRRLAARLPDDLKLTPTAILVKIAAAALRVFPKFNASIDPDNDEAVLKHYVNVAVAVDTEHGLLAPVIRDADRKSLRDIAADLGALSERARERKARPEDLRGANFTVTNLGGLGTTTFAPLVNWPEVAVLGAGRLSEELRPGAEGPEVRLVLPLSISYDHRWIDGADAARFLRWVAEAIESPLLLELGS